MLVLSACDESPKGGGERDNMATAHGSSRSQRPDIKPRESGNDGRRAGGGGGFPRDGWRRVPKNLERSRVQPTVLVRDVSYYSLR